MNNIPSSDSGFDTFQGNLLSYVIPKKVEFEIPDSAITPLTNSQTQWADVWAVAKVKTTRTSQIVEEKDEIRETYEELLRDFIQQYIMVNPKVSDGDRVAMQIKPRATDHPAIPVPTTIPIIEFDLLSGHQVKLYYRQETAEPGSTGRGKPEGVAFCEYKYKIGGQAPVSPSECPYAVNASRSSHVMTFAPEQAGSKVYLYGRWVTAKGLVGGWTEITEFIVP